MKLWEKSTQPLEEIDRFTVGHDRELDLYLAPYDVLGSMAHVTMLHSINLIADNELQPLLNELRHIYHTTQNGQFVIEDGIEDVHSQVELMLTRKLGDMGKKYTPDAHATTKCSSTSNSTHATNCNKSSRP